MKDLINQANHFWDLMQLDKNKLLNVKVECQMKEDISKRYRWRRNQWFILDKQIRQELQRDIRETEKVIMECLTDEQLDQAEILNKTLILYSPLYHQLQGLILIKRSFLHEQTIH